MVENTDLGSRPFIELKLFYCACVSPAPVRMVCGSVRVWPVLLRPLPVQSQSLHVLGGAASPLSGCVTMKMTVGTDQMKSVPPHALQISSAAPAHQGSSKLGPLASLTLTVAKTRKYSPCNRNQ